MSRKNLGRAVVICICMKSVIFSLLLCASPFVFCFGLLVLSSGDAGPPGFPADMLRAEVYRIMEPPLNTDPQTVAVWYCGAKASRDRTWRGLLGTADGIVAVFGPDDKTVMHSYAYSATTMDTTISDSYVLAWARDQRERSESPAQK